MLAIYILNLISFCAILVGGIDHSGLENLALSMAEPAPFLLEHMRAEQRPTAAQDGWEEDGTGADGPPAIGVPASAFPLRTDVISAAGADLFAEDSGLPACIKP